VDSAGNIRCPCKSCRLVLWVSIKHLADHNSKYGFDPSYKTWIHHGEADLPQPPPVIDNIRQPQMSDMTACLNELSYIHLNNEQNEPTQGDIGETSNDPTQAKRNEFEELYASANEELYPGCDYVTRLDFMVKFTYFKAKGKLTDSIFNEMLEFFQNVFPTAKGYKLPPSYYAIKKTFKTIGLGLQRLYKSSHTVKEMTWHATGKCTKPGKMQHPVDGKAWKDFDTKYSDFAAEPRNVRLGLAADGFNPGRHKNFEGLKLLENSVDVLKIMENKLTSMKILENKLESLKLQENQPVDGLVPLSIKKLHPKVSLRGC
nr:hypothetical protein [Tanacetum cinerariifolium]GFA97114.1 hypothetical protein [Tanacetum cinerariifolium]